MKQNFNSDRSRSHSKSNQKNKNIDLIGNYEDEALEIDAMIEKVQ